MDIRILLFYKFVDVAEPGVFAEEHAAMCKEIGVLGKVLVAKEGINGSVSGTPEQTEKYKQELAKDARFSDIVFKEDIGMSHPFKKMSVKVKKEIIRMDLEVDMSKRAKYISPKEFLELYEKGEEMIVLDARNDYESKVGKFKNAITPAIQNFRDFPKVAEELADKKNAKIVTYCTGGIRCEKASAYLVEQGFTNVSQLEGGILTFGKQFPNTVWEGKCFVFDKRLLTPINDEDKNGCITDCVSCGVACDLFRNCTNVACNERIIQCISCEEKLQGCCSKECFLTHIRTQVPIIQN